MQCWLFLSHLLAQVLNAGELLKPSRKTKKVLNDLFNIQKLFLRANLKSYFLIAFLTVATLGLSNSAVAYLNFPTFNMFKSCKLIPGIILFLLLEQI
jgi:hypothetical protein